MNQFRLDKAISRIFVLCVTIIFLCIFAYGILTISSQPIPEHPFFNDTENKNSVKIIANRGGVGDWPENTLYAFQQSEEIGVDAITIDLRISLDDTLVAIHDSNVQRTTNGFGDVRKLTTRELQSLDAGYQWSNDDGSTFKYRDQGIIIPTINEVFAEIPNMQIYVDIKSEELLAAKLLCISTRDYNLTEKVLVSADNDLVLAQFREICPEIATCASAKETRVFASLNAAFLTPIYSPRFHLVKLPPIWYGLQIITPNLVRSAHLRGLRIYAVNINEYVQMEFVMQQGIDGIFTNYPHLLIASIDTNNIFD